MPERVQCKACPWKTSTRPAEDIPGGYTDARHRALACTIATPGEYAPSANLRMMACHESSPGTEKPCVGWLVNQLGPGNNIPLRIQAMSGEFGSFRTDGPQHATFEDTLPRSTYRKRRRHA